MVAPHRLRAGVRATLLLLSGLCLLLQASNPAIARQSGLSPNISDYVASNLDDFTATMHIVQHDDRAGEKINKDFGLIYKLHGDILVHYKDENRLRLDGKLGASKVTFIVNETKQYVRFPALGLRTTNDLGQSPGKRKTLLDVGLLSKGYLAYTEAQFMGPRPIAGVTCALFKVSYRNKDLDTSFRLVWIDPKTKVTLKREEHGQTGKLVATFYYRDPTEVAPGIWFPSRIEALNNEGQKAGETAYQDVKINTGIEDSIFHL